MKVAVVHDWLTGMRGGEKVLEGILELYPQAKVYTLLHFKEKISPAINRHEIETSFLQRLPAFVKKKYSFLLPLMPWAIESFNLKCFDLVISSSHCVAKAVKAEKKARHYCYCHSPMRYAYDMFQAYFGEKNWLYRNFIKFWLYFIRKWDQATVERVDYFIANSKNTANKIKRYYGREAAIINPPVDTDYFTPAKGKAKGDYYLIVSALVPYKKVDLAVKAFKQLPEKRLVVIGSGVEFEKIKALAGENVELKGWSSDQEIKRHYRQCKAFLFPGEEDFGITALEAQSCGNPVIAYRKGGCLETVIEGKTGLFFERQSPEELVKAIKAFELKRFKALECRKNALKYSKKSFKARMKAFIEKHQA
jgi:glycosyltransferase involved in cell wall biosynthesis